MKNLKKKGFTIVELVIVIAVIAVLAAVLIPTFSNLINKANEASKTQIVRNLNVALATNIEGHKTMHDALETVEDNGYKVEKLTPTEDGLVILYDITQDRFILVDDKGKEVYPKDGKTSNNKYDLWKIADSYDQQTEYSVYLTDAFTGTTLEVATGIDVGNNPVTQVTYTGANNVTIRTLGNCQFNVTGTGTVDHYGEALVELGNTHNCHADVYQQGNNSSEGIEKGFAGGNGSESQPYLITTNEHWNAVANVAGENAYFEILTDIVLDEKATLISNASGYFNFNNNTIYIEESYNGENGVYVDNAIFDYAKNIKISNLNINMEKATTLIHRPDENVYFENVNTYGSVEVSGNNSGLFTGLVGYSGSGQYVNMTFKNCNNYADVTGDGFVGVYVGTLAYTSVDTRISLIDCNNYGAIISTGAASGAAMIFSNPSSIKGASAYKYEMYLENVRNYGIISSPVSAGLIMSNAGKAGRFEYTEPGLIRGEILFYSDLQFTNLITKDGERVKLNDDITPAEIDVKNAGTGVNAKVIYDQFEVNDDKVFDLSSIVSNDAVRYEFRFVFNGVHGKANGGSAALTFNLTPSDITNAKIYAYEWLNFDTYGDPKPLDKAEGEIVEHTEYGLTYYTCGNNYVFKLDGCVIRIQPTVVAYAYNANGEIINIVTYNYPTK